MNYKPEIMPEVSKKPIYDIISVCPLGMHGSDCTTPCDSNCGNSGCHVNGAGCLDICPAGFSGANCHTGMQ